jgi:hypothetical protein
LKKGEETDKAIAELEKQLVAGAAKPEIADRGRRTVDVAADYSKIPAPAFKLGDQWRPGRRGAWRWPPSGQSMPRLSASMLT